MKNITEKNITVIIFIYLTLFFIILIIVEKDTIEIKEKEVTAEIVKEVELDYNINLGIFTEEEITDMNILKNNWILPMVSNNIVNGNGEYKLKEIEDSRIVLERDKQIIAIKGYTDAVSMYKDFKNKEIDAIVSIEGLSYPQYIGEFGYKVKEYLGDKEYCITLNKKFSPEVQQAFLSSVNVGKMIDEEFLGKGKINEDLEYDLDSTVKLLEKEGYKYVRGYWLKGYSNLCCNILLSELMEDEMKIAKSIKSSFDKIGIECELEVVNVREYEERVLNNEFDIILDISSQNEKNSIKGNKYMLFSNVLELLHCPNLVGHIAPDIGNIFNGIESWKKVV